jgi:hypothetical protein
MKKTDAIKHFGKAASLARALGVERQAISNWRDVVPFHRQQQLESITGGALKAMTWQEFNGLKDK